jgi:salicylate hydroxylase
MRSDPDLAVLAEETQNFWMGPGGACAAGAVPDLGVYNACFTSEEKLGAQGEWFVKGDLGRIAEKYKDWDPRLVKVLKLAKPEDCYVWNITDLPPLPTWSSGNTVLLGDAAHATLPFMGLVSKALSQLD